MIAITKYLHEAKTVNTNYAVAQDGTQTIFDPKTGQIVRLPMKAAPVPIPVAAEQPVMQTAPAVQTAPAASITNVAKKSAPKIIRRIVKEQPVGIQAPVKNQYIEDLQAKVKAGARAGGGEEAYQNAVRLNAARQAVKGPAGVPTVPPIAAVHPPKIVPAAVPTVAQAQPVQQVVAQQPVPVTNVTKAVQAADISGTQAAGIALKKGAESAGEAAGSFGKKAMEFAGENPGAAGLAAGAIGALGLRKLLNRNKQQT